VHHRSYQVGSEAAKRPFWTMPMEDSSISGSDSEKGIIESDTDGEVD